MSGRGAARSPRVAFVMERVIGHATWALNLRAALGALSQVAVWIETALHRDGGIPERIQGLPRTVRAGWRALLGVRRGLAGQRYDALEFNTQKAGRLPALLAADPDFS